MKQFLFIVCLFFSLSAQAQERGIEEVQSRFDGRRGDVFAVVVGISEYSASGIRDLSYADQDARAFAAFLQSEKGGRVPEENIRLLLDERATYVEIRSALLDWLPIQANKRNHTAIVFFAGHGVLQHNTPLFLAHNTNPQKLVGSSVSMDKVNEAFELIEADRKLFFGDTCHSGALLVEQVASRSYTGNLMVDRLKGKGRAIITSSKDSENSYESNKLRAGLFTHSLLEGLNGAADSDNDGYVTLNEAYEYTYNSVADLAKSIGKLQHPRMQMDVDGVVLLSQVKQAVQKQTLRISVNEDASLFLNGEASGALKADQSIALDLTPGTHSIRAEASGYQSVTQTITVNPNTEAFINLSLSKTEQIYRGGDMVYVSDFGFWIDKYEVTNAQFAEFVGETGHRTSRYAGDSRFNGANHPVVGVSFGDAEAYCEWAGKRLPTSEEWQQACTGTDGRIYPWGNQAPDFSSANYAKIVGQTRVVGGYPKGASPYGALDMAGNVWEWTASARGTDRATHGGSWINGADNIRCTIRLYSYPDLQYSTIGFRCVR